MSPRARRPVDPRWPMLRTWLRYQIAQAHRHEHVNGKIDGTEIPMQAYLSMLHAVQAEMTRLTTRTTRKPERKR